MSTLRAWLAHGAAALVACRSDVVPPLVPCLDGLVSFFVDAELSQILKKNLSARETLRLDLFGAVFAASKAMGISKLLPTVVAFPEAVMGSHLRLISKSLGIRSKIFNEIESSLVC